MSLPAQPLVQVRELDGKMENLGMEVKDFEGAVKLQGAMVEKISASRAKDPEGKGKEKKMTETQRAMLEAKIMQVRHQATYTLYTRADVSSVLSASSPSWMWPPSCPRRRETETRTLTR